MSWLNWFLQRIRTWSNGGRGETERQREREKERERERKRERDRERERETEKERERQRERQGQRERERETERERNCSLNTKWKSAKRFCSLQEGKFIDTDHYDHCVIAYPERLYNFGVKSQIFTR